MHARRYLQQYLCASSADFRIFTNLGFDVDWLCRGLQKDLLFGLWKILFLRGSLDYARALCVFQLVIDDDVRTVVGFANPASPVFLLAQ